MRKKIVNNKLPIRFELPTYKEPSKPKVGAKQFREELVKSVGCRAHYFPKAHNMNWREDEWDNEEEWDGKYSDRQAISLKEINSLVKQYSLNEENVYLTASFADDYLMVDVVHVKLLSEEEKEEEYQDQLIVWNKYQEGLKKSEKERIEREMKRLQQQMESLQKK